MHSPESLYFLLLAGTACGLLWGVALWNGTVAALVTAACTGRFEDGTPLATSYTGLSAIDFPVSLLVAFFFYGTNGSHPAFQIFLVDAYATLQSAFVWLYAESSRFHSKPYAVAYPIIWALLWQAFGAAIALPLFFRKHLEWCKSNAKPLPASELRPSQALPFSFALGALLPAVIGMLPTWYPRPDQLHQQILAAWQPDPIWVAVVQATLTTVLSRLPTEKSDERSVGWLQASYVIAAMSSAVGHMYAFATLMLSSDPRLGFKGAYVPSLFSGPPGAALKLANGPWLFLQYDLIIISLSALSWAYLLVTPIVGKESWVRNLLPLLIMVAGFVFGAGTVVSVILFWREGKMQQERRSRKANVAKRSD
ncbi:uncharacterized protein K452DRAFT_329092 [Aplosporella prunicola CBS 121167]|uniref:Uncharacterized protein n=1 Tax=Aplosporella prunicola CBS 121167 TaxID=1176127 RepID=A0A6A6B3B2_9PEZI|nr:uncharacterized protein K452DRAFT_329092 [Aplosporella prunicola CBS 121167]KAF2137745.1 hypothetical protein K452DRAFT_329092 [Aplosporella prunicola CBS 121167]